MSCRILRSEAYRCGRQPFFFNVPLIYINDYLERLDGNEISANANQTRRGKNQKREREFPSRHSMRELRRVGGWLARMITQSIPSNFTQRHEPLGLREGMNTQISAGTTIINEPKKKVLGNVLIQVWLNTTTDEVKRLENRNQHMREQGRELVACIKVGPLRMPQGRAFCLDW